MPYASRTINQLTKLTFNAKAKRVNLSICQFVNCCVKPRGFTLIELLVVIAIFGLTATLITASYLTFERNQRLKNAAMMIKSDIRLVADKAFSGDKGSGSDSSVACIDPGWAVLGGWYMRFEEDASNYRIAGDCITNSDGELNFDQKLINLPKDVKIYKISYGTTHLDLSQISILFQPVSHEVYISAASTSPNPHFFQELGPNDFTPSLEDTDYTGGDLIIKLQIGSDDNIYQLTVKSTGEVYAEKSTI